MICAAAFYPITDWLMSDPLSLGDRATPAAPLFGASVTDLWLCALIGLVVTGGLFVITDYYTSTRFRPVKTISQASRPATRPTSSRASRRASSPRSPRRC